VPITKKDAAAQY